MLFTLKYILGNGLMQSELHLVRGKLALLFSLSLMASDFLLIDLSSVLSLHSYCILFFVAFQRNSAGYTEEFR